LHEILKEHALLPKLSKETRFFDIHFHRGAEWYRTHFRTSQQERIVGEVAPTYFASSDARERIAKTVPGAKVVCIFRDPVDRILSLYRLKRAYGLIPWNFEQAIVRDPELTESSKYATNLKEWRRVLGEDRVLPTVYEDIRDKPQSYVDSVVDFIGIPRFTLTPPQLKRIFASEALTHPRSYCRTRSATMMADWCKARRLDRVVTTVKNSPLLKLFLGGGPPFADLPQDVALRLYEDFRPEVEELEVVLNRDLSQWKWGSSLLRSSQAAV
jgi:hypothetical protein